MNSWKMRILKTFMDKQCLYSLYLDCGVTSLAHVLSEDGLFTEEQAAFHGACMVGALTHLQVMNSERPPAAQFDDDAVTVKLLTMIRDADNLFFTAADDEINAAEGVPGTPGVRRFQPVSAETAAKLARRPRTLKAKSD